MFFLFPNNIDNVYLNTFKPIKCDSGAFNSYFNGLSIFNDFVHLDALINQTLSKIFNTLFRCVKLNIKKFVFAVQKLTVFFCKIKQTEIQPVTNQ